MKDTNFEGRKKITKFRSIGVLTSVCTSTRLYTYALDYLNLHAVKIQLSYRQYSARKLVALKRLKLKSILCLQNAWRWYRRNNTYSYLQALIEGNNNSVLGSLIPMAFNVRTPWIGRLECIKILSDYLCKQYSAKAARRKRKIELFLHSLDGKKLQKFQSDPGFEQISLFTKTYSVSTFSPSEEQSQDSAFFNERATTSADELTIISPEGDVESIGKTTTDYHKALTNDILFAYETDGIVSYSQKISP